jgi:hypothetical protein
MQTLSLALFSLVLALPSSPVTAQVREVHFGGSGESWERVTSLNVLSDVTTVRGAMQPLELRPDVNAVPIIYGAHTWELWQNPPNPLWEPGIPRFWRGFGNYGPKTPGPSTNVMIDGDPTTFWSQENFGPGGCKMKQEFHTMAPGGPLPLERFVLTMPPDEITDIFGRPFSEYVPKNGELSAGWSGAEKQAAEEQRLDLFGGRGHTLVYAPFNDVLGVVRNNIQTSLVFDFPLTYYSHVRWITYGDIDNRCGKGGMARQIGYADLELYGRGFASESFFRTTVQDLRAPAILADVRVETSKWRRRPGHWEETFDILGEVKDRKWMPGELLPEPDAKADAVVRIRTGITNNPLAYFTYSDFGELEPVSESVWRSLGNAATISCFGKCGKSILKKEPGWQGPVVHDRENWTAWSGPIRDEMVRLSLPKGRYFQVQAIMNSRNGVST